MRRFVNLSVCLVIGVSCGSEPVTSQLETTGVDVAWDAAVDTAQPGVCQGKADGTSCDDEDPCTLDDVCSNGACVGSRNEPCESENPCQTGTCVAGKGCEYAPAEDGAPCAIACFGKAQCLSGECTVEPDSQVVCPPPGDDKPCVSEVQCDPKTGACDIDVLAPEGTSCDQDSDLCTLDACTAEGACVSTEATNTCASEMEAQPCQTWQCNKKSGECKSSGFAGEISCDDGNACTEGDTCALDDFGFASCEGTIIPIDDNNPCTNDSCVDGVISHDSIDGKACETGNPCVPVGLCTGGECLTNEACECVFDTDCPQPEDKCLGQAYCDTSGVKPYCAIKPGTVVSCESIGSQCLTNSCVPQSGQCVVQPLEDGIPCSDGSACTLADSCKSGVCGGGTVINCDDGNYCNGVEACDPELGCQPGVAPNISDSNPCTLDVCDEATDAAVHTPSDALCDNGDACDGIETCDALVGCVAGVAKVIDDGLNCTVDSCDPMTGTVTHAPQDAACDNGLFCDGQESCDVKNGCVEGDAPTADDGVSCTETVCDEASDTLLHTPNDGLCMTDTLCMTGICDPTSGCSFEPLTACCGNEVVEADETCDDGNLLNGDGCDSQCLVEPPQTENVSTYNFGDFEQYPLHLDNCKPSMGACCLPTTTQEQMNQFCLLAGYEKGNAVSWVVELLVTPSCYCWGSCVGFSWHPKCCTDTQSRNVVTSVDCEI